MTPYFRSNHCPSFVTASIRGLLGVLFCITTLFTTQKANAEDVFEKNFTFKTNVKVTDFLCNSNFQSTQVTYTISPAIVRTLNNFSSFNLNLLSQSPQLQLNNSYCPEFLKKLTVSGEITSINVSLKSINRTMDCPEHSGSYTIHSESYLFQFESLSTDMRENVFKLELIQDNSNCGSPW